MTPPARLPTVRGAAEVMEPLGYVLERAPAPGAEQDWDSQPLETMKTFG